MRVKRYFEEFKIAAVRQVTDRGHSVSDVAQRLGVTDKTVHEWLKKYSSKSDPQQALTSQQELIRKLKAELRQVTKERDILMESVAHFPNGSKEITR